MVEVFRCPACKTSLKGWPPSKCFSCGHVIRIDEGVLIFSDDPNLNLDGPGTKYIGYDTIAFQYDQTRHSERQIDVGLGKAVADVVGPGKILLDVGAGTGSLDMEIARAGCKIIAGDISLNMLKILSSKLKYVPAQSIIPCRLNAYSLPIETQSIDGAMATAFFHLIEDPALIVREIQRVLKPDGVFITAFADFEGPSDDINAKIVRYYYELIEEKGVTLAARPGWSIQQTESNLRNLFHDCKVVEGDNLVFRSTATPKRELEKIGNRANSDQVELDEQVHHEIMEEICRRLVSEYGEHFRDIKQEYSLKFRLGVFSG